MAKLQPILEYCECGCHSNVPYCPTCKSNPDCRNITQLSDSDRQKFCEQCGTEFDWSGLEKIGNYYNDWRKKARAVVNENFVLYNEGDYYAIVEIQDKIETKEHISYRLKTIKVLCNDGVEALFGMPEVDEVFEVSQTKTGGYNGNWYIRTLEDAYKEFGWEELKWQ